ncbi:uncharacterized protein IWZ02DRAFT_142207 [Phyllosticta citriasiana]|uniref:uncharacterized protein n=1 Tax=Phyllosticta citriasiana TaxID=595635 RepID=UPI0030FD47F0
MGSERTGIVLTVLEPDESRSLLVDDVLRQAVVASSAWLLVAGTPEDVIDAGRMAKFLVFNFLTFPFVPRISFVTSAAILSRHVLLFRSARRSDPAPSLRYPEASPRSWRRADRYGWHASDEWQTNLRIRWLTNRDLGCARRRRHSLALFFTPRSTPHEVPCLPVAALRCSNQTCVTINCERRRLCWTLDSAAAASLQHVCRRL